MAEQVVCLSGADLPLSPVSITMHHRAAPLAMDGSLLRLPRRLHVSCCHLHAKWQQQPQRLLAPHLVREVRPNMRGPLWMDVVEEEREGKGGGIALT